MAGTPKTARRPRRIYEYVDTEGVVFYSFTRLDGFQNRRMMLVDVRGVYYRRHITEIARLAEQGTEEPEDE